MQNIWKLHIKTSDGNGIQTNYGRHGIRTWLPQQHSRDTVGRLRQTQKLAPNISATFHSDRYAIGIFPPEIVRRDPISVLIDAGQTRLARTGFRRIGHIGSRQAFTLLALLSKGLRRNEALTFSSGLSNSQVERLLHKYISWGLVTPTRRITQAGLDELEHARRLLQKAVDVAPISKESYYPTKLRGPTGG